MSMKIKQTNNIYSTMIRRATLYQTSNHKYTVQCRTKKHKFILIYFVTTQNKTFVLPSKWRFEPSFTSNGEDQRLYNFSYVQRKKSNPVGICQFLIFTKCVIFIFYLTALIEIFDW